ncbi:MAG: hypothetical protein JWM57_3692 [Phycisphaerales bacterium]|nr:hypothetical protein [Phycisphaerales bacterium]
MKSDPRDYQLDISSIPKVNAGPAPVTTRPYLSVLFNCCKVYQRVYRDTEGSSYTGRCPKCLRTIRFVVGEGGTAGRSFVVE